MVRICNIKPECKLILSYYKEQTMAILSKSISSHNRSGGYHQQPIQINQQQFQPVQQVYQQYPIQQFTASRNPINQSQFQNEQQSQKVIINFFGVY